MQSCHQSLLSSPQDVVGNLPPTQDNIELQEIIKSRVSCYSYTYTRQELGCINQVASVIGHDSK